MQRTGRDAGHCRVFAGDDFNILDDGEEEPVRAEEQRVAAGTDAGDRIGPRCVGGGVENDLAVLDEMDGDGRLLLTVVVAGLGSAADGADGEFQVEFDGVAVASDAERLPMRAVQEHKGVVTGVELAEAVAPILKGWGDLHDAIRAEQAEDEAGERCAVAVARDAADRGAFVQFRVEGDVIGSTDRDRVGVSCGAPVIDLDGIDAGRDLGDEVPPRGVGGNRCHQVQAVVEVHQRPGDWAGRVGNRTGQ